MTKAETPTLQFASQRAWEEWLEVHHSSSDGLWLKFAKAGSGVDSVSYPEAVDSALCYGWIDGVRTALDDKFFLQRFTPRRKRSKWSAINREKAITLIREGRMQPAGLSQVEEARNDGRWDTAYDSQSTATVPEDFQAELAKCPVAAEFFTRLDSRNRYAILYRIQDAKKPETRARRIQQFVEALEKHQTPWPQRAGRES